MGMWDRWGGVRWEKEKKVERKLIYRLEDNKRNNTIMEIISRKQKPKMGIFLVLFLKV